MSESNTGWTIIEGRHPVEEALKAGQKIREILIEQGVRGGGIALIERLASERRVPTRRVSKEEFRRIVSTQAPQGVVAFAHPIDYAQLDDVLGKKGNHPGLLLVCDGVVDPHNLGALIRTADCAGFDAVIIPKHRAVGLTQTVIKASAGAALYVPVVRVTNISRTLADLKRAGYWIAGASPKGEQTLWESDFTGQTAIVIGGEGTGLSRLVEESCDYLVSIPMLGRVNSLNASVAGALFMFEAQRQRRK